jgi:hypothetical protein
VQLEAEAIADGLWIVCHEPLSDTGVPVGQQALRRGFWNVNENTSVGRRVVQHLDGPVEVPPPSLVRLVTEPR